MNDTSPMADVKTDLLVDIGNEDPEDHVPSLPLNLKSVGSVAKVASSSNITPGPLYGSEISGGITTSRRTKSRISSIFSSRPTILNLDDDPFDLKSLKANADDKISRDPFDTPPTTKNVRTGILFNLDDDAKDEANNVIDTDWEKLRFEANAVVGDIHLSTKRNKRPKLESNRLRGLDLSIISPINDENISESILNISDLNCNDTLMPMPKEKTDFLGEKPKNKFDYREKENIPHVSDHSQNVTAAKLLDFSACELSDLEEDMIKCKIENQTLNTDVEHRNLLDLNVTEMNEKYDTPSYGKSMCRFSFQQLPDVVINTNDSNQRQNLCQPTEAAISYKQERQQTLLSNSGSMHHIATPFKVPKSTGQLVNSVKPITPKNVQNSAVKSGLVTPSRMSMHYYNNDNKPTRRSIFDSSKTVETIKNIRNGLSSSGKETLKRQPNIAGSQFKLPAPLKVSTSKGTDNAKTSRQIKPTTKPTSSYTTTKKSETKPQKLIVKKPQPATLSSRNPNLAQGRKYNTDKKALPNGDNKQKPVVNTKIKDVRIVSSNNMAPIISKSKCLACPSKCSKSASKETSDEQIAPKSNNGDKNHTDGGTYNLQEALNQFNSKGRSIILYIITNAVKSGLIDVLI